MKKIVSATDLGGAPFFKNDMREVFNSEIWAALQALLAPFDSDTEGLIISGCVFTNNAGNFDMTAGIVYLNGEFMRIAAVTNQTYTKYIAPKTPTSDSRTFADGTTHAVVETKEAEIVGSAPGAGQYVTINNLTGMSERVWTNIITNRQIATVFQSTLEALGGLRTEGSGAYLKTKVVQLGDWDMDATAFILVTHGVADFTKIRSITGVVRNDADTLYYAIGGADGEVYFYPNAGDSFIGSPGISATTVTVSRRGSGFFDGTDFNSTSFNRGYIVITYEA